SEDVRARISVLSEIPDRWARYHKRWNRLNRSSRRELDDTYAPSRNDEYLLYQILLGIWPFHKPDNEELAELSNRVVTYMRKAAREAKVSSSWINPNSEYEAAMQ